VWKKPNDCGAGCSKGGRLRGGVEDAKRRVKRGGLGERDMATATMRNTVWWGGRGRASEDRGKEVVHTYKVGTGSGDSESVKNTRGKSARG